MKKIYSISILWGIFVFYTAHAQLKVSSVGLTPISAEATKNQSGNPSSLALDTLDPPVFTTSCFTSDPTPFVYYKIGSLGYLAGNNSYGETECAQRYPFTGSGTIGEVLIWYGKKTGTTGTTSAIVYSIDATPQKNPMTALGTSATISIASILSTGYTSYTFSPAISVTTDFAVAAVLPTTAASGDTVAIVSTKLICHSADSLSYLNIAQFGGWKSVAILFNKVNPLDTSVDLMIRPVVDVAVGINEYPFSNGLTLMGAYPNPAGDFTNIQYNIKEQANVSIEVFDLAGRVIQQSTENLNAGTHNLKVALKGIPSGNYYYTIKTEDAIITSKFAVAK